MDKCSFCGKEEEHITVLQEAGCSNSELRICSDCNKPKPLPKIHIHPHGARMIADFTKRGWIKDFGDMKR